MRVVYDLTSYWGTYLPSLILEPGSVGRNVSGVFVPEGHLRNFDGYDKSVHRVVEQRHIDPVERWVSNAVVMDVVNGTVSAPGGVASGKVCLRFSGANQVAIILQGACSKAFLDLRLVKELMLRLRDEKKWDGGLCLVSEVVTVDSAWVGFATAKDQTAEISASAPLALPAEPTGALSALAGKGKIEASAAGAKTSAFCANLPSGGTPLFRAIRFKTLPIGSPIQYVMGGPDPHFELQEFGDGAAAGS